MATPCMLPTTRGSPFALVSADQLTAGPACLQKWGEKLPAMSSSAAVASWGALIKALTTLVDGPTAYAGKTPAHRAAEKQFDSVAALQPLTRAGWKKLILDDKVSKRACCMQHKHSLVMMAAVHRHSNNHSSTVLACK